MRIQRLMSRASSGNRSLTRRLLIQLLIPVLLLISIAGCVAIFVASQSINTLFDQQLKNNAEILLSFLQYEYAEEGQNNSAAESGDDLSEELVEIASEIESRQGLSILYRLRVGNTVLYTASQARSFPSCSPGFNDFEKQGTADLPSMMWRCYRTTRSLLQSDTPLDVEFFEHVTERQEAIKSLLLATFSPIVLLPFVVLLVAWWVVLRGMKSLTVVSRAVSERSVNNLNRIPCAGQHTELLPIVQSVNKLLAGIELGVLREKQFTDDAAHELRTPITSIKMLEQLIRRENTDPAITGYLDSLKDSADHSSLLIDQLLKLARLQSTQSIEKTSLDLYELVNAQLGLLSPLITNKKLVVQFDCDGRSIDIDAHEPSLSLMINNLLTNAIKFNDRQGTLYISLNSTSLRIEDDGPGIKTEDATRVFDRFFRAANTRAMQGTGLGLSLVKWVVDIHGFTIKVEAPSKGTGANFVVYFNAEQD